MPGGFGHERRPERLGWWASLLVWAIAGCAQVVGADFGDYQLAENGGGGSGAGTSVGGSGGAGGATGPNVLIVHRVKPARAQALRTGLMATQLLGDVAIQAEGMSFPMPPDLEPYDAVLVANDTDWFNVDGLSATLESYFIAGGRVVVMASSFCDITPIGTPFDQELAFTVGALQPGVELGTIESAHPLFAGVGPFVTNPDYCSVGLAGGTMPVASIPSTTTPLIATRMVRMRERVDINALYTDADPAMHRLIANALRFE